MIIPSRLTNVQLDVFCHWGDKSPSYRIYIDDELMTERTFIWPGFKNYIREVALVNLTPGPHSIRLENLNPDRGEFIVENITVDDVPANLDFCIE